ncbi:MAG TPA: BamA/TamA family outer membrane protein [Kofleriaceae bacterium]
MTRLAFILLSLAPTFATASADPVVASSSTPSVRPPDSPDALAAQPRPRPKEVTAADVQDAPVPGTESGQSTALDPGDSAFRVAARGLLFVPKLAVAAVLSPVRGAFWANDRYGLEDLYYRVFYNDDRTIGLFPTATYTSGFGAAAGAGFVDLQLFGERESLAMLATTGAVTGDTYRASLAGSFRTGRRISPWLELGLDANFDRHPADPFYGIGNGDLVQPAGSPVNPQTDATAVATYHRYQEARAAVIGDVRLIDGLHVLGTGSLTDLKFGPSTTNMSIDTVYATPDLVGFDTGVRHAYGELELRWDTRRRTSPWEPRDVHATGSLASMLAGRVHRLDDGADFWRYRVELQHYWKIASGPRLVAVRFHGAGVTGERSEVPFTELPMLGGSSFLRGYSFERFRDRVAAFGSVQYQWDLSHLIDAYLFTDVGRVFPGLDQLTARGMRVGYGVGLELHGNRGFLVESSLASSLDGGVVFSVSFNPVLDTKERWR